MPDASLHPLAAMPSADAILLFAESNTRFLCEVRPGDAARLEAALADVPHARVGEVTGDGRLEIMGISRPRAGEGVRSNARLEAAKVIDSDIAALKEAWLAPLDW